MKWLRISGGALLIVTSVLLFRIVYHLYAEHAQLDVFHLLVGSAAALAALFLLVTARPART